MGSLAKTFAIICIVNSLYLASGGSFNEAQPCSEDICKLPDCRCSTANIPGGLSPSEVPQMIMITFDDSVNVGNFRYYESLFNDGFKSRKNRNGCNITATFFVRHKYTDYQSVQKLRHWRHEIADHSITHRTPTTWWKNATYEEWTNEITGQREILRKFGNIDQSTVKGFRAPYLQPGGNKQFKALFDAKFLYDSSMAAMETGLWPYTLDYKTTQKCFTGPCPTDSFPGLWEIPLTDYTDNTGTKCAMVDECRTTGSLSDVYDLLMKNFMTHYQANRAPFPVFMHAGWFIRYPSAAEALAKFIDKVLQLQDVYIVTMSQVISWVKNPTPLSKIDSFTPWQCNDAPPPPACESAASCQYAIPPWGEHVYMKTCTNPCPKNYPWYGNPDGN